MTTSVPAYMVATLDPDVDRLLREPGVLPARPGRESWQSIDVFSGPDSSFPDVSRLSVTVHDNTSPRRAAPPAQRSERPVNEMFGFDVWSMPE